jgi:hypothetical protein
LIVAIQEGMDNGVVEDLSDIRKNYTVIITGIFGSKAGILFSTEI